MSKTDPGGNPSLHECPVDGCAFRRPKPGNTASHAWQKHDRWNGYEEALQAVEEYNENRKTASGSGDGDGGVGGSDETPANPLLSMPDHRSEGRPPCPDCGDTMEPTGAGMKLEATRRTDGQTFIATTESGDMVCHDCSVYRTDDTHFDYE